MRKTIVLVIILILVVSFVSARSYPPDTDRFDLEEGQSAQLNGKKITLMNLDYDNERVIVCVNGEKTILSQSRTKTINGAILDLRQVYLNRAEIKMWVDCPNCECDESCDNSVCFDECFRDRDCDDGNDLTEDKCSGDPKRCHSEKTKECTIDYHCDDGDICTIDKCSEVLGKCINTEKNNCLEQEISKSKITSATVMDTTEKYAQTLHPLLLSIAFGIMMLAVLMKKFM